MLVVYTYYVYISVDTAVEGEVSHLRIAEFVSGVVGSYNKKVFVLYVVTVNFYTEGGIAAVVSDKLFTVEEYLSGGVYCLKLNICYLVDGKLFLFESLYKITLCTQVVVTAVLAVLFVPGIGKVECAPIGRVCGRNFLCIK